MSCCPPAGLYNIVADQGATFSRTITWKDYARRPIALTGYTGRMQVRPTAASNTIILELTTGNGRITLGASNGQISLKVVDEVMSTIEPDKYVYDLELVSPGGDVYKIVQGNFVVRAEVTR